MGTLCLVVLFIGGMLHAQESPDWDAREWRVEVRPGYAYLTDGGDNSHGATVGAMAGWRFYDSLSLKLDLDYSQFGLAKGDPGVRFLEMALGFNYDIDVLWVIPSIGTGVGPLFRRYEGHDWDTQAAWHIMGALVYPFSSLMAIGIEARAHLVVTDFNQDPLYLTFVAKLQMAF